MIITFAISLLLVISLSSNAALFYWAKRLEKTSLEKKPPQESYEVRQLLHDLTSGVALVKVQRVAPSDVFLRSARDTE